MKKLSLESKNWDAFFIEDVAEIISGRDIYEKERIDGLVPYCPTCKQFRFPMFNSAISTIIFNPTKDKILLIKQRLKVAVFQ